MHNVLISECKVCIGSCLGLGMKFNPFLSTLFVFQLESGLFG